MNAEFVKGAKKGDEIHIKMILAEDQKPGICLALDLAGNSSVSSFANVLLVDYVAVVGVVKKTPKIGEEWLDYNSKRVVVVFQNGVDNEWSTVIDVDYPNDPAVTLRTDGLKRI